MSGFKGSPGGLPPPARTLWDTLGVPDRSHPWGDRLSCSLLSLRSPGLYDASNVPLLAEAGYTHLPAVLLDAEVLRGRLRCCYPFDAGSTKLHCGTFGGGAGCTPGCGDRDYAQREARPWGFEGDARAYKPDELAKCLDGMEAERCVEGRWCALSHNELVLDIADSGDDGLQRFVRAVVVDSRASGMAVRLARAVWAVAEQSNRTVPLLHYDPRSVAAPFSEVDNEG